MQANLTIGAGPHISICCTFSIVGHTKAGRLTRTSSALAGRCSRSIASVMKLWLNFHDSVGRSSVNQSLMRGSFAHLKDSSKHAMVEGHKCKLFELLAAENVLLGLRTTNEQPRHGPEKDQLGSRR